MFWFSLLLLVFGFDIGVRHYRIFPYSLIQAGIDSVSQVYAERETVIGIMGSQTRHRTLRSANLAHFLLPPHGGVIACLIVRPFFVDELFRFLRALLGVNAC